MIIRCLAVVCTALTVAAATPARAQERIVVVDATSKQPIRDAEVFVGGSAVSLRTSDFGTVVLSGVPSRSALTVRVRRVGYASVDTTFDERARSEPRLIVYLERAEPLPAATVLALEAARWQLQGFEQRQRAGGGRFFPSSALRKAESGGSVRLLTAMRSLGYAPRQVKRNCRPHIILDGISVLDLPERLEFAETRNYEAVEYYTSQITTPTRWSGPKAECGTLVFWTRIP